MERDKNDKKVNMVSAFTARMGTSMGVYVVRLKLHNPVSAIRQMMDNIWSNLGAVVDVVGRALGEEPESLI